MSPNVQSKSGSKPLSARNHKLPTLFCIGVAALLTLAATGQHPTDVAVDPGVRGGTAGAGAAIAGLSANQKAFFAAGQMDFQEVDSVKGSISGTGAGLGPRFNAEGCAQCHAAPAVGGSSPTINPQFAAAIDQGATNTIPDFLTQNGPVREARFPFLSDMKTPDGGVHPLFTISGRTDAPGCSLAQPNFADAESKGNLIFRIPTPTFGDGLIEAIPEFAILNNMNANRTTKKGLGITGHPNTSGNDGSITRFGWKAQNKSLEIFSGEAYKVEMGVTNEEFPNEKVESPSCQFAVSPEDHTHFGSTGPALASDVITFAAFMRMLDQPVPAAATTSTTHGRQLFDSVGCSLCHTASFTTAENSVGALSKIPANLFSDLLVHHMGPTLADNVSQGAAGGDEFRTAPLWGLGQRIFFLHDGRSSDLVQVILGHAGDADTRYPASEANGVIQNYKNLQVSDQQDLLNFLRSL